MSEGFIILHRSITDNWVWNKFPFSEGQAWVDLLLLANHEDNKIPYKGEVIICKRGTVNRSISSLADRWKWSREKTRRFLALLENDKMVTTKATTHRTTITIENYGFYQDLPTTKRTTNKTASEATSAQQAHTNNNDNNVNNIYPNGYIKEKFGSDDVVKAFDDYKKHRKLLKSPLSEKAAQLAVDKLVKLSGGNSDVAVQIINQSIREGWKGLFELKGGNYGSGSNKNSGLSGNTEDYSGFNLKLYD